MYCEYHLNIPTKIFLLIVITPDPINLTKITILAELIHDGLGAENSEDESWFVNDLKDMCYQ